MTDEAILRSEGQKAAHRWGAFKDNGSNNYTDFIAFIKEELTRFYTPLNKAVFLDEVYKQMGLVLAENQERNAEKLAQGEARYVAFHGMLHKILFYLQQEIDELPKVVHSNPVHNEERDTVFISYSHLDKKWLNVLKRHFKPLENRIDFWDDSRIKPGQEWEKEIKAALSKAKVALLLISADFFNSDFITRKEIPPLLEMAKSDGATILFWVLKPCLLEEYPDLIKYQGLNAPSRPFIKMKEAEREELCVSIVQQIRDTLAK